MEASRRNIVVCDVVADMKSTADVKQQFPDVLGTVSSALLNSCEESKLLFEEHLIALFRRLMRW